MLSKLGTQNQPEYYPCNSILTTYIHENKLTINLKEPFPEHWLIMGLTTLPILFAVYCHLRVDNCR